METGTIYVLRSNSQLDYIKEHRSVIHKIGVTGGDIKKRIANAENDPTFLMATVELVDTYSLEGYNRVKLENLIHKFFQPAQLSVTIKDRFGKPVKPREWFLVTTSVIEEAIEKIEDRSIVDYRYSPSLGEIISI